MKEAWLYFIKWDGYKKSAAGYLSLQHILFATGFVIVTVLLALYFARWSRGNEKAVDKTLRWAAVVDLGLYILRIVMMSVKHHDAMEFRSQMPFFLCRFNAVAIMLIGFGKGNLKKMATNFLAVYAPVGWLFGTYFATWANNSALLTYDAINGTTEHSVQGFVMLYLILSGRVKLSKKDFLNNALLLGALCALALMMNGINTWLPSAEHNYEVNYMYLSTADGTPFSILYDAAGGNAVLYAVNIILLHYLWGVLCISGVLLVKRVRRRGMQPQSAPA